MNPKSLIAPVLTGAIIAVAMAFYIKTLKAQLREKETQVGEMIKAKTDMGASAATAEKAKTEALVAKDTAEKSLADLKAEMTALTDAKAKTDADLNNTKARLTEVGSELDGLKTNSAKVTKEAAELTSRLEDTKKKLADTEALKAQAEGKLKSMQAELAESKKVSETVKDSGFLVIQYKTNADVVRKQVEQLVQDVPDLVNKLSLSSGSRIGSSSDTLRIEMAQRMAVLNLEGEFAYTSDNGDPLKDVLSWSIGAVVIGTDSNQVYLIATPPPRLLDQPAARNSLTKNCTLKFTVHPPGWSGVKDPLPAAFLGVLRASGKASVAVLAVPVADWPQGREKPLPLIAAPTVQECRQWSVNGDIGFLYTRGVPNTPGAGAVRVDTPIRVGEQEVELVLPAQAVGYELALFGTYKAPSDKSILGIYYPDGSRIVWLSDLYNGVKGLAAEMAKRAEVGAGYVSADWVVGLGESPNARSVDTVVTEFVSFIEKR